MNGPTGPNSTHRRAAAAALIQAHRNTENRVTGREEITSLANSESATIIEANDEQSGEHPQVSDANLVTTSAEASEPMQPEEFVRQLELWTDERPIASNVINFDLQLQIEPLPPPA